MPLQDTLIMPEVAYITVATEPVQNIMHSLMLLTRAREVSGFSNWIYETAEQMGPEKREMHRMITLGFYYALMPRQSWPSFPVYLEHIATCNPVILRDRMLETYASRPLINQNGGELTHSSPLIPDKEAVLKDFSSYLGFLRSRYEEEYIDEELESWAYTYVINPPAMQALVAGHLKQLWSTYLEFEWQRVEPMLKDSVNAFQQVDFSNMSKLDAARAVTGQDLKAENWQQKLTNPERIIFVPSAHVGPYLGKFEAGNTLWMIFGARLPEGSEYQAPALSRAQIVVRLNALADDTRLQILNLISEQGELPSQEVMNALDLSQSAASRHLKQLSATGYLIERRHKGAKHYSLNPQRIENTLCAISAYLLKKSPIVNHYHMLEPT